MSERPASYVYGHVFESLTAGLYPNKQEILREYIQNAFDAMTVARSKGLTDVEMIKVQVDGNDLFIHDEGIGMNEQSIEEYRFFGYSTKKMDDSVGFRGIGKLAGLAVADRMVVVSKKQGEAFKYTYTCDASLMLKAVRTAKQSAENLPLDQLIEKYSKITKQEESIDKHYTTVQLYGIHDDEGVLTQPERIMNYLASVAPVPFHPDFRYSSRIEKNLRKYIPSYQTVRIQVNGDEVYKPYSDDMPLSNLRFYPVKKGRKRSAIAWALCHTKPKQIDSSLPRGLFYRCKGFAVGDDNLVRSTLFTTGRANISTWFAGEIHVLDTEVIPSASRTDFEDTPARSMLYEAAKNEVAKKLNAVADEMSKNNRMRRSLNKAEQIVRKTEKLVSQQGVHKFDKNKLISDLEQVRLDLTKKQKQSNVEGKTEEISQVTQTIEKLTKDLKNNKGLINIEQELGLNGDALVVYNTIMKKVEKWFLKNQPDEFRGLVQEIHKALGKRRS